MDRATSRGGGEKGGGRERRGTSVDGLVSQIIS